MPSTSLLLSALFAGVVAVLVTLAIERWRSGLRQRCNRFTPGGGWRSSVRHAAAGNP